MKKLILTLGLGLLTCSTYAQGVVSMNTVGGGANAPATFGPTTNRVSGTQFFAQLFWGQGANAALDTLIAVTNPPATFATGSFAGYINTASGGGNRVLPVPGNMGSASTVTLQIRAWDRALGNDYASARAAWLAGPPNLYLGTSGPVNVILTEPPTAAATLAGLPAFTLNQVPEPSLIALGVIGGLGVLLLRRRKN
jgi:hypothetical protein